MAVEVRFPGPLQTLAGGSRSLALDGATVGDLLAQIGGQYPSLHDRIVDENGAIHRFVNVYLNDEDVRYLGGLDAPVAQGDVVAILPALAGG